MMLATAFLAATLATGSGDAQIVGSPCAAWRSERTPPNSIRVLLVRTGRVVAVPFALYVERVMASEWSSTPPELRKAGAVVVKQYAWSRVIRWSGRSSHGRCFHVTSGVGDQIYRPDARPRPEVVDAVRTTWRWTLRGPDGRLLHTGYRTGSPGHCAKDAGQRLYARSARRCAEAGWTARAILLAYFADRGARLWT